jgi:prepilin-type N-terminal cleavage/methylation domain-containing protein
MKRAFTLIELLIVIAIIAILALIAVPNFLEAQTRAKVSRTNADQRSIGVAIEAYSVDWGGPPIGQWEAICWTPSYYGHPNGASQIVAMWSTLTTPVAYMTSIPYDVFIDKGFKNMAGGNVANRDLFHYTYHSVFPVTRGGGGGSMGPMFAAAANYGVSWYLESYGPSRRYSANIDQGRSGARALARQPTATGGNAQMGYPDLFYDSTNGTMSFGYIMRSNLGNP